MSYFSQIFAVSLIDFIDTAWPQTVLFVIVVNTKGTFSTPNLVINSSNLAQSMSPLKGFFWYFPPSGTWNKRSLRKRFLGIEPICLIFPSVVSKWPFDGMVNFFPGYLWLNIFLTISIRTASAALPCWIMKALGRSNWAAPPLNKPPEYSHKYISFIIFSISVQSVLTKLIIFFQFFSPPLSNISLKVSKST